MRLKTIVATVLAVILGCSIYIATPRRSVDGITIGETLFQSQTFIENFTYRKLVKDVMRGNSAAFAALVKADCGGGAGCYEHGEVLVYILLRGGELGFINLTRPLKFEEREDLKSLLDAGFEYGIFDETQRRPELSRDFPNLSKLLSQNN